MLLTPNSFAFYPLINSVLPEICKKCWYWYIKFHDAAVYYSIIGFSYLYVILILVAGYTTGVPGRLCLSETVLTISKGAEECRHVY